MSKKFVLAASLMLAFVGAAQAQTCSCDPNGTRVDPSTLLQGRMICGTVNNETWQEWHGAASELWDYKLGTGHPTDPSSKVGTWSATSTAVTYSYTGGASYTYEVCAVGNTYTYCGASKITGLRIGGAGLQACTAVKNATIVRSAVVR